MGFLRRFVGGDRPPLPEWSPFDDWSSHQAFIDAVQADLRRRGIDYAMGDGLVLIPRAGEDEPSQHGLSNLSQQCSSHARHDWPQIIATHFSSVFANLGRDLDALAADYDRVRPILRVRLYGSNSTKGFDFLVSQSIASGIDAVLVYDFPESTSTVNREHLASWPVDAQTAFEQGLANLALEPMPVGDDMEVEPGSSVRLWYGDSFYVATRVLQLGDVLPDGTTDALVAVPNRHTLVVHPIVDRGAIPAMHAIYRLAVQLHRDGPGSISDQPYWWHDGTLVQIPHRDQGSKIVVVPPDGLLAVFETVLARSEKD